VTREPPPTPVSMARTLDALAEAGRSLSRRPVAEVVLALGSVGERFLDPGDALRREALARLPDDARVSPEQARWTLDGMARDWTPQQLTRLLVAEFAVPRVLDGFVALPHDPVPRRLRALGPSLAFHVTAGTVPGVSVSSLIRGLLVKGPVLLKPGAGDALLPTLFARGLTEAPGAGPELAAALAVRYWPGGTEALEGPALAAADQVVVYGSDATVTAVGRRLGPHQRLVAYPHRVSVAVLASRALAPQARSAVVVALARAAASFDQRGCVCPHQVFLPGASGEAVSDFARALAGALEREVGRLPPGPLDPDEAAAVHQVRGAAEMRAAAGQGVELHAGPGLAWTVVLDPEPALAPACLARTLHLTPLGGIEELGPILAPLARHLQSVGTAGFADAGPDAEALAEVLARNGATRIVPLDGMPFPPPWWRHDGRGPLTDLVRWVEWEPESLSPGGGAGSSPAPA
jgi:hypothetical protein